ncbi:dimethylsulfoniopropionate demethylase [Aestuariispira insulae]|uniref:Dimethylsulfoniopropionate demethylase n=1 Tax=Aestuariispira insulae TaxID=1461337 RepID=A0A3D9H8G7_9PROT|nr:dimethylsulfoniopropionate demethylase [Aestuariispira insulae]RED45769.1 dimethylsulfoniopropionate demethylase [Aestuariispira insulae]
MSAPILAISRRTRRTPYTDRIEALGVKAYTVYNHMLLPTAFISPEEDYWHLRQHVQLWDVACERQVEINGPDAARLVQLMTPRNLSKVVVGQCAYAPLVDEKGGMINDPIILKLAEDRYWLSIADSDVLLWARGLAVGMGLDVAICEPDVSPLAVQGPKADDLMADVFGEDVRDIRFFRFKWLEFRGHPLLIARSGWSKQGGFEIYLDRSDMGEDLWDTIWEAGAQYEIRPGCPNLIERIEGALLSYGNDFTNDHNPLECGLGQYCDLDSEIDYLGKQALLAARDKGITRQFRGVSFEGEHCPSWRQAWPVLKGGQKVGEVMSVCRSPALDRNIAIAMMDKSAWEGGTEIEVETPEGRRRGMVCDLPFKVPPME